MENQNGEGDLGAFGDIFEEEESYFKKPIPPHTEEVEIGEYKFNLSLIGEHSLWGHLVWNAAKAMSELMIKKPEIVQGKSLLELGAGSGLPSMVAAKTGAKYVMLTDYPEEDIISTLISNTNRNLDEELLKSVDVEGYIWNTDTEKLIKKSKCEYFDVILMTDLINHHHAHNDLIKSCMTLGKKGVTEVYVVFSHHRPWLKKDDLKFFDLAKDNGWKTEKIGEYKFKEMFPEDPGDVETRRTVHAFRCKF